MLELWYCDFDFRPWDDHFMIACVETYNPIMWDLSLNVYSEGFTFQILPYFIITCHSQFCYDVRWHLISPRDESRLSLIIWACSFRFWQPYIIYLIGTTLSLTEYTCSFLANSLTWMEKWMNWDSWWLEGWIKYDVTFALMMSLLI